VPDIEQSPLAKLMALPPPKPDDRQFYEAFGRFISNYAGAENAIHQLMRHISGLSEVKARLLFGGMRVADVSSRIKALLPASRKGPKARKDIEACLKQFNVIGLQRDKMVHRDMTFDGDGLQVSNHLTSRTIFGYEQDHFKLKDLQNMDLDCMIILLRLMRIISPRLGKSHRREFLAVLYEPWRYKPSPPVVAKAGHQKIAALLLKQKNPKTT
jgi:hypothetical protein